MTYWGLRAYGTEPVIWGGSPDCPHTLEAAPAGKALTGGTGSASAKQVTNAGSQYGNAWSDHGPSSMRSRNGQGETTLHESGPHGVQPHGAQVTPKLDASVTLHPSQGATCTRCGAWRGELGSEPTPELYVAHIVEVFRAVRRVLHPTATVWLNLGDGYADKQLLMLPARVALALQADGWVLRSAITWAKKSPMPESVRDRPTNATEQVYLLAKQPTYYYDAEAVRQPNTPLTIQVHSRYPEGPNTRHNKTVEAFGHHGVLNQNGAASLQGASLRNFWLLGPEPYSAAHFATFPRKLVEPCVLAGTSARGQCPRCRAPWRRVVEQGRVTATGGSATGARASNMSTVSPLGQDPQRSAYNTGVFEAHEHITTGWQPTCPCQPAEPVPQTVLDPFLGSGTTAYVARHHGRRAVGIELNEGYAQLAADRLRQGTLGLEVF